MIKVTDSVYNQPNVDDVTPVFVPNCGTRSYTMKVIFINGYGKYQEKMGYWDDVDKVWREFNGQRIVGEVIRSEPIAETIKHYDD